MCVGCVVLEGANNKMIRRLIKINRFIDKCSTFDPLGSCSRSSAAVSIQQAIPLRGQLTQTMGGMMMVVMMMS